MTHTFLFTDVEGSTALWERDAAAMRRALAAHDDILRRSIESRGGRVFKTVGDAFCAAFESTPEAVAAAVEIQTALQAELGQAPETPRVRIALQCRRGR